MAGSVNKVILIGNLGADPEVRYTPGGQAVANFRLATNESWVDRQGQKQERAEWHRVVVWGKQAELCGEYLNKGRKVFVEGRLQTRQWEDRDGQKRYTTEVMARDIVFLDGRAEGGAPRSHVEGAPPAPGGAQGGPQGVDDSLPPMDDDVPF